jgi:RNA polymerase sigma factor (sigma-70 family)
MPTDPDQDILELVRSGQRDQAVRLLMQRHGKFVYRFVRTMLRGRPSVDDVHSRVFIEADRDLPRFRGRSSLRSWLYSIAHHRILDELKAERTRNANFEPLRNLDVPDGSASAAERLDDAELMNAVRDCIDRLSEESRQALLLRYQQGFSFEQMSEVCDEKSGTLQARVTRALPALKACIETRTHSRI